jgi:hypothetical protein
MNICKDCKYWTPTNGKSYRAKSALLGDCDCAKFVTGYYDDSEPVPVARDGVLVEDDEGWGFYTGPEFGCIHWSAK